MILRSILLKLAGNRRFTEFLSRKGMSTGIARRFVAGETAQEAVQEIRRLNDQDISATFDHLGENVLDAAGADQATEACMDLIEIIEKEELRANVSLKLTQLGLDLGDELCLGNMRRILTRAEESGMFIRIDMEGAQYTQRTLKIVHALWRDCKNVGTVIQSYLYRSGQDVEDLMEMGVRVRLCKGAYKEPRRVAFPRKKDVDKSYQNLVTRLLEKGEYPAIATHDPTMIEHTVAEANRLGRDPSSWEFQMLYGIRVGEQLRLRKEGYGMRVYVPYGKQWCPYFMRRIAERPANALFVLKNILRS